MNFDDVQVILPRIWMRAGVIAASSVGLVWFFSDAFAGLDLVDTSKTVSNYGWTTWACAAVFTFISFWAISGYDPIITKALKLDIPDRRAASTGWKATAISQIAGFGLVTGTIIRWLELGHNPTRNSKATAVQAFTMTATVSGCFMVACTLIAVAILAITYLDAFRCGLLFAGVVALAVAMKFLRPSVFRRIRRVQRQAGMFGFLTLIDTLFAALVVYVFLPIDLVPFSTIFTAFLLSFIVGMISGLPGGIGPFEICMIALLPAVDSNQLAPALLAFRLVYFAVPAVLALGSVALGLLGPKVQGKNWSSHAKIPASLRKFSPPERDLISDNPLTCAVSSDGSEGALIMANERSIVQLGDTFNNELSSSDLLSKLRGYAQWSKSDFCIYRCNRSTALRAYGIGLKAIRFSSEAIIRPRLFTLNVPNRSGLRRKIKKANKLGISVNSQPVNIAELTKINDEWVSHHGQARGFSTGVYSPDRIERQRIYVAYKDNVAVGFVTFSSANKKWLLDLIKYKADCPNGAIYLVIVQAIQDARLNAVETVSLGSVPFSPALDSRGFFEHLSRLIFRRNSSLRGLYQFKESFRPEWQDRYFAFDTMFGAVRSVLTITKAIHRTHKRHTKSR